MKYIILLLISTVAFADNRHQHNYEPVNIPVILDFSTINDTNLTTQTVETTQLTTFDDCQGVSMAMAAGNNQMYFGTNKPQASIGVGECGGDVAGSLMFGMKLRNNIMLNGSWGFDERVNAFGVGGTFIFK